MKAILSLILLLVFLMGCGITGKVAQEIEEQLTQEEKDQIKLDQALAEKDVTVCYSIQTQPIRENCFVQIAKELKDPSVCDNLLRGLRDLCKAEVIK